MPAAVQAILTAPSSHKSALLFSAFGAWAGIAFGETIVAPMLVGAVGALALFYATLILNRT